MADSGEPNIAAGGAPDGGEAGKSLLPAIPLRTNLPVIVPQARLRRRTRRAFLTMGALLLGLLFMALVVQVSGAVVAQGALGAESQVKTISHPTGGTLGELLVRDGSRVRQGDVLLRFDNAVSQAGAELSGASVDELRARRARLEAEREGLGSIRFPRELQVSSTPAAQAAMEREQRMFSLKRSERTGQVALLRDRENQYLAQIQSYQVQIGAIRDQEALIRPELQGLRDLYAKQLVTINRLNQLERTAVSLAGEAAALEANIAQARSGISEVRQQMLGIAQTARADAGSELSQVMTALNDGELRSVGATDAFERSIVRAPQSGIVDKLVYTTIGAAIPAGQPILQIVPDTDQLVVEARVSPADIDQLRIGQPARVRFTAFNAQTTPEVAGRLTFVSAERGTDEHTGVSFYRVRVAVDNQAFERQTGLRLTAGMPAEVFITTGSRSLLSYLIKPIVDQFARAFRDN